MTQKNVDQKHRERLSRERLSDPWPLLIVDNFLPESVVAQALQDIEAHGGKFTIEDRRVGRIEYDVLRSECLWRHLYSIDTTNLLSANFGGSISLDARNLIQLRRSDDATPAFGVHNDFFEGEDTIVSFLYLSAGWKTENGGELLLFSCDTALEPAAVVKPIQNRFVAFRTLPTHWHAVAKVKNWTRFSAMALWKRKNSITSE